MIDYYIHQIGNINDLETYLRFKIILECRCICSRKTLEEMGIIHNYEKASFKLDIPLEKQYIYCNEDIHKDRVSLSNPNNRFIRKAIENKNHKSYTCFDYDYLAFAVSKDVPIVSIDQTKSLALGEVQVKDKIDEKYIVGLVLPISEEDLLTENKLLIVENICQLCEQNDFHLDIYNYEGKLIREKNKQKSK
jgi:hypothetical protein